MTAEENHVIESGPSFSAACKDPPPTTKQKREENHAIDLGPSFSAACKDPPPPTKQKREKKICWLCSMNELHNFP